MSYRATIKLLLLSLMLNFMIYAQGSAPDDSLSILSKELESLAIDEAMNPLQPVETSSPSATLYSFIENVHKAYLTLMLAHKENSMVKGLFTPDSIKAKGKKAELFFQRAERCLNLIDIPEALRANLGMRQAIKLKEILDRINLPPPERHPGEEKFIDEEAEKSAAKITAGRLPHTEIVISRVENGVRKGEYLFSPETVKRLDEFYSKVELLPYKSESWVTPGFYNFYISNPGKLVPPRWTELLPDWTRTFFLEQTIWQWLFFIFYLIVSIIIFIIGIRWLNPLNPAYSPLRRDLSRILSILLLLVILAGLDFLDKEQINMTGYAKIIITVPGVTLFWLLSAVFVLLIFKVLAEVIIASPKINPVDIQASYIRAVFTVIGFFLAMIVFIFGLSRVGVSLAPLLAGVGIGGFAIALAARPTLENIIGSFMIFADKPFKVGHRIKVTGYDGFVEEIGLRSTKIRLLDGNLTSIPNEKMVTIEIENIGRRPYIRRTFNICITYDTPPAKILRAVQILNEILSVPSESNIAVNNPKNMTKDSATNDVIVHHPNEAINKPGFPPRIYFNDFNADSLNIYVSYWYHPPELWEFNEHAHSINLQIKERFNSEGIEFAFPTQTIHLSDQVDELKQIRGSDNDK